MKVGKFNKALLGCMVTVIANMGILSKVTISNKHLIYEISRYVTLKDLAKDFSEETFEGGWRLIVASFYFYYIMCQLVSLKVNNKL